MKLFNEIKNDLNVANSRRFPSFFKALYLLTFDTGFFAIFMYRLYSRLYLKNIGCKFIAKLLWRINILITGSYIQPQASIGAGFCLPHPIGVVIGEGVKIGKYVKVYQGVTLGSGTSGEYPVIEDNVVIYATTTVVGNARIGSGSIIGANSFVNKSFEKNAILAGTPARQIAKKTT